MKKFKSFNKLNEMKNDIQYNVDEKFMDIILEFELKDISKLIERIESYNIDEYDLIDDDNQKIYKNLMILKDWLNL